MFGGDDWIPQPVVLKAEVHESVGQGNPFLYSKSGTDGPSSDIAMSLLGPSVPDLE